MARRPERTPSARLDWPALRAALAASADTPDQALRLSPEQLAQATEAWEGLVDRAASDPPPEVDPRTQHVLFTVDGIRFGLELAWVRSVVRLSDFAAIPGTPEHLVGLTHLRGELIALFDPGRLLDLPTRGLPERSRVVVVGRERGELGLVADEVHAVARLDPPERPWLTTGPGAHLVLGEAPDGTVVLDGERLLADPLLSVPREAGR